MVLATVILTWADSLQSGNTETGTLLLEDDRSQACAAGVLRSLGGKGNKPPEFLSVTLIAPGHTARVLAVNPAEITRLAEQSAGEQKDISPV